MIIECESCATVSTAHEKDLLCAGLEDSIFLVPALAGQIDPAFGFRDDVPAGTPERYGRRVARPCVTRPSSPCLCHVVITIL
jgi:hypothetical protein